MFDTIISIAIAFFGNKEPPIVVAYGKIKIASETRRCQYTGWSIDQYRHDTMNPEIEKLLTIVRASKR